MNGKKHFATEKPPMTTTTDIATQLDTTFGLAGIELRYGLTQDELVHEAIAHDRGRVEIDGPDNAQKAFATLARVGPLVYYSDPECTGRPVKDTYCVNRPATTSRVWWKDGFAKFDPDAFDTLLPEVIDHLNERQRHLYVTDVFCGWDPTFAEPYRFIGEFANHAHFGNIMFPKAVREDNDSNEAGWTLINVPSFECVPERDDTRPATGPSSSTSRTGSGSSSARPTTAQV